MNYKNKEGILKKAVILLAIIVLLSATAAYAQECVKCHKDTTPNIVTDWQLSKHSQNEVDCTVCHGENHKDPYDVENVEIPTPTTCANCHQEKVEQRI